MTKNKTLNAKLLLMTALTFIFFVLPLFSIAQILPEESLIIKSIPKNPKPEQIVSVSIESYYTDLNRANSIAWYVDGVLVSKNVSVNKISVETKSIGKSTNVEVVVVTENGSVLSKSVVIRPSEVDILWETNSYVPHFYKGKALPSSESDITFVAVSRIVNQNGRALSPSELVYKWRQDGKILGKLSGRGKNTITIKGPSLLNSDLVQVEVESANGQYSGGGAVSVKAISPKIILYEKNPLLGPVYENAIDKSFSFSEKEMTFIAHPFFFSANKRTDSNLEYSWRVNGKEIENPATDQSALTLRQTGGGGGTATIVLTIRNMQKILQLAKSSFSISFKSETENSFSF